MIEKILIGDILESQAQTLVNTVNCVGIMGKGIAFEFKKKFPDMFKDYDTRCKKGEVKLGKPYLYRRAVPPWILNFPTKDHWRSISHIEDIIEGLKYLADNYMKWGIKSLAVPPLGMGSGKLIWEYVAPIIYKHLNKIDVPIEFYAPYNTPKEQLSTEFLSKGLEIKIKPGLIIIMEIIKRIFENKYHIPISKTKFQKIAYLATIIGIPTGLQFRKGTYGPYEPGLDEVKAQLINSRILTEIKKGRGFYQMIGDDYSKYRNQYIRFINKWESEIEKVADLFLRLDAKQSEIVGTVIFSYQELVNKIDERATEKIVYNEVMSWKKRHKPPLQESEVADSIRSLAILGWLDVEYSKDLPVSDVFDEF